MATLISKNPGTGEILKELQTTPPEALGKIFTQADAAQKLWAATPAAERAHVLLRLRETLLDQVDETTELISQENGKPKFEAMVNELLPCVDHLTFFAKKGPKVLRNKKIPLSLMKHRTSRLEYWPLGVVVIISPWNYPFLLPFGEIVMALITGNAVVFKPSEITPLVGLKIQSLIDESGFPEHLVQTVVGDGTLGAALIQQKPAKIFFTGSVATGKKIMSAAAEHLIPVNLELGGKDAMIVLPDADLDFASSAALWGGFSNSGQVCASVERILLHEKISEPFLALLKEKISKLRQGYSLDQKKDLGVITFEKQKQVYKNHIEEAKTRGATFVSGGTFSEDQTYLQPTVVTGSNIEDLKIYNEETFGPVVAVTTFRNIQEAVAKANKSRYGLLASVITKDQRLGEEVARQLQVGTVTLNEVTYTAGLAETPWGGVKESGFGRTHSEIGLLEFVNIRHIHMSKSRFLVFKSPWWFPYTDFQFQAFRKFFELYRRSWWDKLKALPDFLWNFLKFIKNEPRL